ncbi:glucuronoxylanase [Chitinophaga oryziterrae]|uniref:Glucuronoxylanase n=1 Tax=Chitinophaga oryziterrae TaxID=1031224 RepID=A0A6N8JH99_9BACT|nr:glucuronoxylanase [Chitinophaga oryziterrae]MVT44344.1 glucuronoxylanase [Chitinophaga oryziterrae]
MKTTLFLRTLGMSFLSLSLIISSCVKQQNSKEIVPDKKGNAAEGAADVAIMATATIDANTVQQTIQGFGGMSVPIWIGDLTADQRTKAFSAGSGIGMSILRVMVPTTSSQFAAEKPTIDAAKSYGAKVIATAWNAPSSMMDGLYLRASAWGDYAAHLSAYTQAVGGVYALSPWNEPNYMASGWMHASATEIADFVAAQGNNCGAPIMCPEPFNMDQTFINTYLSNATAKSKTLFVSGHIYGKTPYNLGNIGKSVWMTEHYTNSSISGNDWPNAMNAAKEIHDCMTAGWAAYVWWYIRRSYGPIDENSNITKVGYVMAHFARYVRPGYTKIACPGNPTTGVYTSAYKSGSKIVIVAINTNAAVTYQPFTISGITVNSFNRYVTTSSSNMDSSSLGISNNAFGINLPASSITTLVSN